MITVVTLTIMVRLSPPSSLFFPPFLVDQCLYLSLSLYFIFLSVSPSLPLCLHHFLQLPLSLSIHLSIHLSTYLSIYLSIYLSLSPTPSPPPSLPPSLPTHSLHSLPSLTHSLPLYLSHLLSLPIPISLPLKSSSPLR